MGGVACLQMWMNEGKWNDLKCDFTKVPQSTMCEKVLMKAPEKKQETTQSNSLKVQTRSYQPHLIIIQEVQKITQKPQVLILSFQGWAT